MHMVLIMDSHSTLTIASRGPHQHNGLFLQCRNKGPYNHIAGQLFVTNQYKSRIPEWSYASRKPVVPAIIALENIMKTWSVAANVESSGSRVDCKHAHSLSLSSTTLTPRPFPVQSLGRGRIFKMLASPATRKESEDFSGARVTNNTSARHSQIMIPQFVMHAYGLAKSVRSADGRAWLHAQSNGRWQIGHKDQEKDLQGCSHHLTIRPRSGKDNEHLSAGTRHSFDAKYLRLGSLPVVFIRFL